MAKGAYVGVNGIARKVKKGYVGVDDIAHKIKKAYIGIGGIARPCFGSLGVEYYGTITSLSAARYYIGTGEFNNRAVFAGGYSQLYSNGEYKSNNYNIIETYDNSLTKANLSATLSTPRGSMSSAIAGNYLIFGNGSSTQSNVENATDALNSSFTKTNLNTFSVARVEYGAASTGNYALFAGGGTRTTTGYKNIVEAYNSSLSRLSTTNRSVSVMYMASATFVNNAVFAGGSSGFQSYVSYIDVYNPSLTKTSPTQLSTARGEGIGATVVGNYLIIAGGKAYDNPNGSSITEAFDTSFTRIKISNISSFFRVIGAKTVNGFAIFANDYSGDTIQITVYDSNLTRTFPITTTFGHMSSAMTSVGDFVLFGGGVYSDRKAYSTVYAIQATN